MENKIYMTMAAALFSTALFAQSGTNSPYSQYGLGILSDQSLGYNRGMNGLSLGLRNGSQINTVNPASYSAMDSLTMLFDLGASGQVTNFKEGSVRKNAYNANFEYAVGAFRLLPKVGLSFGMLPYSNVGYNFATTVSGSSDVATSTYSGSGGLHQAFVGIGWNPIGHFSIGANISYLWGTLTRSIAVTHTNSYENTLSRTYTSNVNNYKLDLGAQWQQPLNKTDYVTLGAIVGIGHKLGADATLTSSSTNTQQSKTSTNTYTIDNAYELPMSYGVGAAYTKGTKFTFGADYTLQKWGSVKIPNNSSTSDVYTLQSGQMKDMSKITLGGEWLPNLTGRKFLERVHYRLGASYATPYYKVNGADGPKEISVSAGFGIPIINTYNNRSILNISGQWTHASATDLITENTFRINIGITFNESWFMKWKVE